MTRSELIDRMATGFPQLTRKDVQVAVEELFGAMAQALARNDRVEIRGFGSFSVHQRPPRLGRNPKNGEQVAVPEKWVPHFKAGKELAEGVIRKGLSRDPATGHRSD